MKITKEAAYKAIADINNRKHDNETAHRIQDEVYIDFIESIFHDDYTINEIKEVAQILNTIKDISFTRWFA